MLLKSLILHNIRSYTHEEVEFPTGTVLLSGDIGSGKSSLLLAVEFAIFGVLRGALEGAALLRHGANEGYVQLTAAINGRNVTVRRYLKRTKRAISQDHGYLIVDSKKEDLTALELKSRMLDLLGYPKELVTKSKSLIFRYTVYTPQERMKAILFEDANERLNTLRRVFDIDKYKRIKENAQVYGRILRERTKRLEGELTDLTKKQEQLTRVRSQYETAEQVVEQLAPERERLRQEVEKKQRALQSMEEQVAHLQERKKTLQVLETRLKYELQRKLEVEEELGRVQKQAEVLRQGLTTSDHKTILESLRESEQRWQRIQRQRELVRQELGEYSVRARHASEMKEKITSLDACPVCLQEVHDEHKQKIVDEQNAQIRRWAGQQAALQQKVAELDGQADRLQQDIDHLRAKERDAAVQTVKQRSYKEKAEQVAALERRLPEIREKIEETQQQKAALHKECYQLEHAEQDFKQLKEDLERSRKAWQQREVKYASAQKEVEQLRELHSALQEEVEQKQQAKRRFERLRDLQHWLQEFFLKLMEQIEKHVLLSVYHQFNGLFQEWFSVLIEDESMMARLDDAFSPIIQIEGYETPLEHLSGGEKTSCALAYRLALNKVINEVIGSIHTKDLIILDEPTDGFSTEQLDRVREVLDQLRIAQVILVSHEPKMESFVDAVVRVQKAHQQSTIA